MKRDEQRIAFEAREERHWLDRAESDRDRAWADLQRAMMSMGVHSERIRVLQCEATALEAATVKP